MGTGFPHSIIINERDEIFFKNSCYCVGVPRFRCFLSLICAYIWAFLMVIGCVIDLQLTMHLFFWIYVKLIFLIFWCVIPKFELWYCGISKSEFIFLCNSKLVLNMLGTDFFLLIYAYYLLISFYLRWLFSLLIWIIDLFMSLN